MQVDRPIAIALTLFIILLMVFFLVMPEYKTFKDLRVEIAERSAEHKAEFAYYSALEKVSLELKSHEEDIKKIDDALPQDPEFSRLIYFFQNLTDEDGLLMKNLFISKSSSQSSKNKTNLGGVKEIVFSMDLTGSYDSLGEFLADLEKSARVFEVTSISFGSGSSSQGSQAQSQAQTQQIYNFSLQIKTYSY